MQEIINELEKQHNNGQHLKGYFIGCPICYETKYADGNPVRYSGED